MTSFVLLTQQILFVLLYFVPPGKIPGTWIGSELGSLVKFSHRTSTSDVRKLEGLLLSSEKS